MAKSPRFEAIFDRRTNGGQHDYNRGYIAVGRELCVVIIDPWLPAASFWSFVAERRAKRSRAHYSRSRRSPLPPATPLGG